MELLFCRQGAAPFHPRASMYSIVCRKTRFARCVPNMLGQLSRFLFAEISCLLLRVLLWGNTRSSSDCFVHQEDGFLFDGHRLAEGAAFLARLRDDRGLCASMGERGRQKVRVAERNRANLPVVSLCARFNGWVERTHLVVSGVFRLCREVWEVCSCDRILALRVAIAAIPVATVALS